jgi:hypothetical protein
MDNQNPFYKGPYIQFPFYDLLWIFRNFSSVYGSHLKIIGTYNGAVVDFLIENVGFLPSSEFLPLSFHKNGKIPNLNEAYLQHIGKGKFEIVKENNNYRGVHYF